MQAYIAAMPGWKSEVGRRLDELIEQTVPDVVKAVRRNQPLYGVGERAYFVSVRCFTAYIKATFFAGASLEPVPPVDFKNPEEKALHIHDDDEFDEALLVRWFAQAAALPGWIP